jgi:hypothetical protein
VRANLHFANMAAMLPQVYAKDPEFAAKPTEAVGQAQMEAVKRFAATAEILLKTKVVKGGRLKARSKSLLRSGYSTSVGWLKVSWQETKAQDPLIANRLKDTQDNTDHVQRLLNEASDPKFATERETKLAELRQALEGLKTPQEVTVARGIALDFVMTEDVVILDPSVRAIGDYTRAAAIAHRVWMTPEQYKETFQYDAKKGKSYTEQNGAMAEGSDKAGTLLCVWEIWSQADNRVFHVCDGEDGFCRPPDSPDWTGKRWYPFFLLAWNEIDGGFYPLSDIEMTDKLVKEYNEQREDFVRDRRGMPADHHHPQGRQPHGRGRQEHQQRQGRRQGAGGGRRRSADLQRRLERRDGQAGPAELRHHPDPLRHGADSGRVGHHHRLDHQGQDPRRGADAVRRGPEPQRRPPGHAGRPAQRTGPVLRGGDAAQVLGGRGAEDRRARCVVADHGAG